MTASQRNSNLMGIAVKNTMLSYQSTWTDSITTTDAYNEYVAFLDDIANWQIKQDDALSIPGMVQNRNDIRNKITIILIHFIGSISAWAFKNDKKEIVSRINHSEANLRKLNLSSFKNNAQKVHDVAAANSLALVAYGIPAADITELGLKIVAFDSLIGSVKAKKAEVGTATLKIKLVVRNMINGLKNNLDYNIKQFIDIPLYNAYFLVRKTYNLNAGSTALRGTIMSDDGLCIHRAEISITNPDSARSMFSNKNGKFRFKNLDIDTCTLRIIAEGYLPAEFEITLNRNRTTEFQITMAQVPVPQQQPIVNPPAAKITSA